MTSRNRNRVTIRVWENKPASRDLIYKFSKQLSVTLFSYDDAFGNVPGGGQAACSCT
jgi:hypothetical protein